MFFSKSPVTEKKLMNLYLHNCIKIICKYFYFLDKQKTMNVLLISTNPLKNINFSSLNKKVYSWPHEVNVSLFLMYLFSRNMHIIPSNVMSIGKGFTGIPEHTIWWNWIILGKEEMFDEGRFPTNFIQISYKKWNLLLIQLVTSVKC